LFCLSALSTTCVIRFRSASVTQESGRKQRIKQYIDLNVILVGKGSKKNWFGMIIPNNYCIFAAKANTETSWM